MTRRSDKDRERSIASVRAALCESLGAESVSDSEAVLLSHGTDESLHPPRPPDLVVYPESTDDVVAAVRCCAGAGVPMVPYGAGTSVEGHISALEGGVCVDMSRMASIREISADDLFVTVEAGVSRLQLERELGPRGLFFPVDPGADATLGGMLATGASGTTTVRYGTMREAVLSLTVVLPEGQVMRTRSRAPKSSAGYDLTHLFVGSEGTLGIITEATLRVHPIPEAMAAAICRFATLDAAVQCMLQARAHGLLPARIELLDATMVAAIELRDGLGLESAPTLLTEFHGTHSAVSDDAASFAAVAAGCGGEAVEWTTDTTRRGLLWRARHDAFPSAVALRPGCRGINSDVCVPISALAGCIEEARADIEAQRLTAPIVGHIGDGNFHVIFVLDPDDPAEFERYLQVNDRLVRRAIALGGTCTGEHGVGLGKSKYLMLEHGEVAVHLMHQLKATIDPAGLMNPGKILCSSAAGYLREGAAMTSDRSDVVRVGGSMGAG